MDRHATGTESPAISKYGGDEAKSHRPKWRHVRPLRIVGPSDAGKTTLVERLVSPLAERGPVATVKHLDCLVEVDEPGKDTYRHRAAGAAETYGVMPDGAWFATGRDRQLGRLLVDLVPEYDYVLVEGYSGFAALPAVVLGGRDHAGRAIATAPRGESVDVGHLVEQLDHDAGIETADSLVEAVRHSVDPGEAPSIGTCTARLSTADSAGRLDDRQQQLLEPVLQRARGAVDGDDSLVATRTHHRPELVKPSSHLAIVAVAARTRPDANDAITDVGNRLKEGLPDASIEFTLTWAD